MMHSDTVTVGSHSFLSDTVSIAKQHAIFILGNVTSLRSPFLLSADFLLSFFLDSSIPLSGAYPGDSTRGSGTPLLIKTNLPN